MVRKKNTSVTEEKSVPKKKKSAAASRTRKEKKQTPAVEDVSDDLLQSKRDELKMLCSSINEMRVEHERLTKELKVLYRLIGAFNAMIVGDEIKFEKPATGTTYWSIRAQPVGKTFSLQHHQWKNSTTDHYLYAAGNMFLDMNTGNKACMALNAFLAKL